MDNNGPILEVTHYHSAVYWNTVTCRFRAQVGKNKFDGAEITHSYSSPYTPEDCVLEITGMTDEEVAFVVPLRYCDNGKVFADTIHPGEEKKYVKTYRDSTRIDGDEYDYDVENRLEVKWLE